MGKQRLRILVLAILIILSLTFTACTRAASTPPPTEVVGAETEPVSDTQATMDAVRSAILTQTAQASEAGEVTSTSAAEETEVAVTAETPVDTTPAATPTAMGVTEYTVKPGDWVWKIARDFGVDPQEIIDLNNLTSPSQIQPGVVLQIPGPAVVSGTATPITTGTAVAGGVVHVVKAGEWVWQIGRIYGVDPQAIIDANNLSDPSKIYPGQELVIP